MASGQTGSDENYTRTYSSMLRGPGETPRAEAAAPGERSSTSTEGPCQVAGSSPAGAAPSSLETLSRSFASSGSSWAMTTLGNGLYAAKHDEDALSVQEAELSMKRRIGTSEGDMLAVQANLASTYRALGREEQALRLKRDVYSGYLKLHGEERRETLIAANNFALSLVNLRRFKEAKKFMRKTLPVARRILGDNDEPVLRMRWCFARALYGDDDATLDDLRGAVATLEELERIARRVFGGAHPLKVEIERELRRSRAKLRARETPPTKGES